MFAVGCSDDSAGTPAATVAPTSEAPTTAANTQAPDTTATPAETDPATTETATAAFDLSGDWLLMARVTDNVGYFTGDDTPVLARNYAVTCDDETCAAGSLVVSAPGGDTLGDDHDMTFTFDGTRLAVKGTRQSACLDPATGDASGPDNSAITTTADLVVNEAGDGFTGTTALNLVTPESAECVGEQLSYLADATLHRAAAAPASPTPSIFAGSDTDSDLVQRGVLRCDAGEGCDYRLRISMDDSTADGSTINRQLDFLLTDHGSGTFAGVANYTESCLSDTDGTFVAADAYDITQTAVVGWQLSPAGDPVLISIEKTHGEPAATLTPEQAAICTAWDQESEFAGLPLEGSTPLIDWGVPAANA